MAIRPISRKSGIRYQVQYRGIDMLWISKTFYTKREAVAFEGALKQQKYDGKMVSSAPNKVTVDEFSEKWFSEMLPPASDGHRKEQRYRYRNYVAPAIGTKKLKSVSVTDIVGILNRIAKDGKSEQTQLHIYNLLRKMFGDAVDARVLDFNPVLKKFRPKLPKSETPHFSVQESKQLIAYVEGKEYCLAIWLQLVLGLRVGEVQALTWDDIDFQQAILHVRRAFSRKDTWAKKEKVIKEFPKNKKQRAAKIPPELLLLLKEAKLKSTSQFVAATSYNNEMLSYEHYIATLKRYCQEAGVPVIGTRGLRHSTAGIYLETGAAPEDVGQLLDNPTAVKRYIHGRQRRIDQIAEIIQLRPKAS